MNKNQRQFVLPVRVYYEDTDAAGLVYYANYLRFMERARTEWLRALGYEQSRLVADRVAFVARSVAVDFLKPARLDDQLTVIAEIGALGRAQVTFAQRVERDGELLVTGQVRIACIDPERGRAAALPPQMYQEFLALMTPQAGN